MGAEDGAKGDGLLMVVIAKYVRAEGCEQVLPGAKMLGTVSHPLGH